MLDDATLRLGLTHGAALCAAMTVIVGVSLRQDPRIWTRSAPKDVAAALGPPGPATLRRRRAWGVVMLVVLGSIFGHLVLRILAGSPGAFPAAQVALGSWITFQCFNLYDAVVLDLGLVLFKPRWAFVEGTADLPGLRDPAWHLGNYLKGLVWGTAFAAIVTGLAAALAWVSG